VHGGALTPGAAPAPGSAADAPPSKKDDAQIKELLKATEKLTVANPTDAKVGVAKAVEKNKKDDKPNPKQKDQQEQKVDANNAAKPAEVKPFTLFSAAATANQIADNKDNALLVTSASEKWVSSHEKELKNTAAAFPHIVFAGTDKKVISDLRNQIRNGRKGVKAYLQKSATDFEYIEREKEKDKEAKSAKGK